MLGRQAGCCQPSTWGRRRSPCSSHRRPTVSLDRGSATVWLAGLAALIGLVAATSIVRGGAVLGRHRAETAADLAALAAAARALDGPVAACAAAGTIAARNGASVTRCSLAGEDVEIEVSRPLVVGGVGSWVVTASARAGPARAVRR